MEFPDPVIEIAVEPKTKGDQEKMGEALARLAKEDPSLEFHPMKSSTNNYQRNGRTSSGYYC